jgi:hypothetical protein
VRADDGAIHEVRRPLEPALRIGLLLERRQQAIPDAGTGRRSRESTAGR